ncbi:protein C19orf12 homolog [Parasteatoda tepidariorum]|uniref:protein C19orf12 homolog n=1 Tax=Parasteatoda tepidariorum TaxID=114398 RepID=UPI00077FC495|nr:protein C19orf12 homolog [Parasteatoda tepidariorum]
MPLDTSDVVDFLCTLSEEERMKCTVRQSLKGGLVVGCAAAIGSYILGPIGLAIGGAVGGVFAAATMRYSFFPASQVIATMSQVHRDRLASKIERIMQNFNVSDIALLATMISGDCLLRNRVVTELVDYLRQEMSLALVE